MNRIVKIIIIFLIVTAIGVGAYFGYQFLTRTVQPTGNGNGIIGDETIIKPVLLTNDSVLDYWINQKTNEIYYISEAGQINKALNNRDKETVSSQLIGGLNYIKPSADGSLILASLGYPQNPTFAIYDIGARNWQSLPAGVTAADWDPNSNNRLAYLFNTGPISRLLLLTLSDQKTSEVLRLTQQDLDLDWVSADIIYLKERPSRLVIGSVWEFNLRTRNLRTLISGELGLMAKWSDDGSIALKLGNRKFEVIDNSGRLLSEIDLKTVPSKCAFSDLRIYCAAPDDQSAITATVLPDDYLKKSLATNDNIYLISLLRLGSEPKLFPIKLLGIELLEKDIDADRLELFGGRLLFINRYDKNIYSLEL